MYQKLGPRIDRAANLGEGTGRELRAYKTLQANQTHILQTQLFFFLFFFLPPHTNLTLNTTQHGSLFACCIVVVSWQKEGEGHQLP